MGPRCIVGGRDAAGAGAQGRTDARGSDAARANAQGQGAAEPAPSGRGARASAGAGPRGIAGPRGGAGAKKGAPASVRGQDPAGPGPSRRGGDLGAERDRITRIRVEGQGAAGAELRAGDGRAEFTAWADETDGLVAPMDCASTNLISQYPHKDAPMFGLTAEVEGGKGGETNLQEEEDTRNDPEDSEDFGTDEHSPDEATSADESGEEKFGHPFDSRETLMKPRGRRKRKGGTSEVSDYVAEEPSQQGPRNPSKGKGPAKAQNNAGRKNKIGRTNRP
jgi:hypothetical protein